MIFEGSSEIMRLFIAREALDPHLKVGGAIFNTQLPTSERAKVVFKSGKFYASWYPKQWMGGSTGDSTSCMPICVPTCVMPPARANDSRAVCSMR